MPQVHLNGIEVAYDDQGDGPQTLLLIHGHPFNRSMWRPQVDHFSATGARVIAPDLRGYGGSTVVSGETTMEIFARDLVALLDFLQVECVAIVGLSMGGQVAMEFGRLFPERLSALVLAATSAAAESDAGRRERRMTADRLWREGMSPYAVEVLPKMLSPSNILGLPEVAAHVLAMMRSTSPDGAAAALRGRAERRDYRDSLKQLACPALVIVGGEDAFTSPDEARLIRDAVPGSTLVVIDGAGHMPNLERPLEFNAAVDRLLASVSPCESSGDGA